MANIFEEFDPNEIKGIAIKESPIEPSVSQDIDSAGFAIDFDPNEIKDIAIPEMPSNMKDTQPETDVNRFIRVTGQYKSERDHRMKNMDIAVQGPFFGFDGIKGYDGPNDIKGADTLSLLEYMPTRGRFDPVRGAVVKELRDNRGVPDDILSVFELGYKREGELTEEMLLETPSTAGSVIGSTVGGALRGSRGGVYGAIIGGGIGAIGNYLLKKKYAPEMQTKLAAEMAYQAAVEGFSEKVIRVGGKLVGHFFKPSERQIPGALQLHKELGEVGRSIPPGDVDALLPHNKVVSTQNVGLDPGEVVQDARIQWLDNMFGMSIVNMDAAQQKKLSKDAVGKEWLNRKVEAFADNIYKNTDPATFSGILTAQFNRNNIVKEYPFLKMLRDMDRDLVYASSGKPITGVDMKEAMDFAAKNADKFPTQSVGMSAADMPIFKRFADLNRYQTFQDTKFNILTPINHEINKYTVQGDTARIALLQQMKSKVVAAEYQMAKNMDIARPGIYAEARLSAADKGIAQSRKLWDGPVMTAMMRKMDTNQSQMFIKNITKGETPVENINTIKEYLLSTPNKSAKFIKRDAEVFENIRHGTFNDMIEQSTKGERSNLLDVNKFQGIWDGYKNNGVAKALFTKEQQDAVENIIHFSRLQEAAGKATGTNMLTLMQAGATVSAAGGVYGVATDNNTMTYGGAAGSIALLFGPKYAAKVWFSPKMTTYLAAGITQLETKHKITNILAKGASKLGTEAGRDVALFADSVMTRYLREVGEIRIREMRNESDHENELEFIKENPGRFTFK
jgi:hypothetical protein